MTTEAPTPTYLTTKEVADLLRVKERKVYDMAAAGEIPHRRITGKLLFPRVEITGWIEGGQSHGAERPPVCAGSHDPLLDWAVRESGSGLATLVNGSLEGLDTFATGQAALAGLHVPEEDNWNVQTVAARGLTGCVLMGWAKRTRGLLLAPALEGKVRVLTDLKGKRLVRRQPGSGAAALLSALLAEQGLKLGDFVDVPDLARTESDAAAAISAGDADAALGIEAMARQFHLAFVPLMSEAFDLIVDRHAFFTEPVQRLMAFARTDACAAKSQALGGYDLSHNGVVRWLSP